MREGFRGYAAPGAIQNRAGDSLGNAPWPGLTEDYFNKLEVSGVVERWISCACGRTELLAADQVVIGTPVYNYDIPAVLKAYIDHIVRKGKTLGYAGEGLVRGKRCTILMASGGVYTEGSPIRDRDVATHYLRLILKVIGIEDVTVVAGGNAKSVDMGETTRAAFLQKFDAEIRAAARG